MDLTDLETNNDAQSILIGNMRHRRATPWILARKSNKPMYYQILESSSAW